MIDQNILFRKISLKLNKKTSANQGVFEFDESPENLLEEEDNQPIQKNREFNSSPMIKLDDQLQQNQSQTFTREFLEDQNLELTSSEKILQVLQVLIIDNVEVKDQKLMLQELYDYVSNLDTQTISNTSSKKQSPMKIQNQAAVNQRGIPDEDYEEIIFSLNDKVRHFEQVNELLKNYTNQSDKEKKELLRQNEKLRTEHDQILQRIREAENQCSQLKDDKNKLEAKNNEQTVKLLDLECEISIFKTLADDQYYHDQRFEMDVNKHQSFKEKNDNSQRVINSDGLLKLKHSSQSQDEPSIKPNQIKISPDKNSISSNGLISRHLTSPLSQIGSLSPEKQERDRIISKQIEALMEQFKKNAIEHSQITKLVELKDQEHRLELKKMQNDFTIFKQRIRHSSQQIEKKDQQVHVYKTKIDDLKLQLKQLQETNQNLQFRINALKDENKLLTLKQETEYICRQSLYRASNMSYQSNVNNSVNQGNLKLSLLKLNQKQNSGIFNQVSTPKRSLISMFGDNFMFPQNSRKVSMNSNYNQQKQSMFGNGGFRSSSLAFQGLQQSYDSNFKEYKHNPFEYLKEENYVQEVENDDSSSIGIPGRVSIMLDELQSTRDSQKYQNSNQSRSRKKISYFSTLKTLTFSQVCHQIILNQQYSLLLRGQCLLQKLGSYNIQDHSQNLQNNDIARVSQGLATQSRISTVKNLQQISNRKSVINNKELLNNSLMSGFLYKKSRSWTEMFSFFGSSWKRKYVILTNVGLVMFDESNLRKPSQFICLLSMDLFEQIPQTEERRPLTFKLTDSQDESVLYLSCESQKEYILWCEAIRDLKYQQKEREAKAVITQHKLITQILK
eukprot:403352592